MLLLLSVHQTFEYGLDSIHFRFCKNSFCLYLQLMLYLLESRADRSLITNSFLRLQKSYLFRFLSFLKFVKQLILLNLRRLALLKTYKIQWYQLVVWLDMSRQLA